MKKKSSIIHFCALAMSILLLTSCGKDFEGSGSKEAASAKQLAMRLEDSWQKPVVKKRDRLDGDYKDGTYKAQAYGMEGFIEVKASIKDNVISITSIKQDYETQSVGGYEAIRDGVYARQIEAAQGEEIDGLAGASITTSAIKTALRSILKQATKSEDFLKDNPVFKDGEYSASKKGFGGDITVKVVIKDGKLTSVVVSGDKETKGVGGYEAIRDGVYAKQIEAAQGKEIDGIAGASITSNAVKDALKEALKKAQ